MRIKKQFIIRYFILVTIFLFCITSASYAQQKKYAIIKSNKENIKYFVNGKRNVWEIDPTLKPARLELYCDKEMNTVKFKTDVDSIQFNIKNKDTVRFAILLNGKDTAFTEVVGVKDLPDKISNTDKIYYLSLFWSEVKYNFINIDKINFDWDSLNHIYLNTVVNTKNDYEYYQELKKFAATLKDGHSEISAGYELTQYFDYIGLTFLDFNKKVYIVNINKNAGIDSTFLGAELIEVEGMPTKKYLEQNIFPFVSASTEQHLWMQGVHKLHLGLKTKPFIGKVKKTSGEIVKINLPRNGEQTRTDQDKWWGIMPVNTPNIVSFKWLKDSIALVEIRGFYPENLVIKQFDNYISSINKAKGLIIDIRNNGGGSTIAANHIISCLLKGKYFLGMGSQTRVNDGVKKANGNWIPEWSDFYKNRAIAYEKPDTVYIADSIKRIKIPTVILISRFTFSAAEDFLITLYEIPERPLFIGEPTGGSTGSPLFVPDLPGGGSFRICTRRVCFPYSNKPFVNEGIKPDILIYPTIQDYMNRKDVVLDKGVEQIEKEIKKK